MNTYDPKLWSMVLAGIPIPVSGLAEDTFIKVERNVDKFTKVVGADGKVTRAKQADDSARVTFSTMQQAEINSVLSTLFNLDANSDNGEGVGPFLLKHRNGVTTYTAKASWIARPPDPTLAKNPTQRDWIVDIESLTGFEGT